MTLSSAPPPFGVFVHDMRKVILAIIMIDLHIKFEMSIALSVLILTQAGPKHKKKLIRR